MHNVEYPKLSHVKHQEIQNFYRELYAEKDRNFNQVLDDLQGALTRLDIAIKELRAYRPI